MHKQRKRLWAPLKEELARLLGEGVIKTQTEIARALGISQATVHTWFSSRGTVPRMARINEVRNYLANLKPTKNHHTSHEGVQRKADLIAKSLEVATPLMEWFVQHGSEEDRDFLRKILGTDLSYQAFNATRALLTEMHHKRVLEEN